MSSKRTRCTCHDIHIDQFRAACRSGAINVKTCFKKIGHLPKCNRCIPMVQTILAEQHMRSQSPLMRDEKTNKFNPQSKDDKMKMNFKIKLVHMLDNGDKIEFISNIEAEGHDEAFMLAKNKFSETVNTLSNSGAIEIDKSKIELEDHNN